jgi:AraC-like DNA-binding protein
MKKPAVANIKTVFEVISASNVWEKCFYSDKVDLTLRSNLFSSCVSTFYTLAICIKGGYEGQIDGEYYKLKSGDLIIYRPGEHHSFINEENFRGRLISFSPDFFSEVHGQINVEFSNSYLRRGANNVISLQKNQLNIIKRYFYNFGCLLNSDRHRNTLEIIKNVVKCILLEVQAQYFIEKDIKKEFSLGKVNILVRFEELLDKNFASHHDVKFYAGQLCITPNYLGKVLRQQCGSGPISIINNRILTEAKSLLSKTNISVSQVSNLLNFSSQAAFSRFFMTKMHLSPLAFRNNSLKAFSVIDSK